MSRSSERGDDPSSYPLSASTNDSHAPPLAQTYSANGTAPFSQNYPTSYGQQWTPINYHGTSHWTPINYHSTPQYPMPAYNQSGPATNFFSPNVPVPNAYQYPGHPTPLSGLNARSEYSLRTHKRRGTRANTNRPFVPQNTRGADKRDDTISNDGALNVGASATVKPPSLEVDRQKNWSPEAAINLLNDSIRKDFLKERQRKDPARVGKIMLAPPLPTKQYLTQASWPPEVHTPPERKLVILDLNGTVIYRPNPRKPKKLIGRRNLHSFLHYLFEHFDVMIWSSAKPENVKALVETGLQEFRFRLVAEWARDTLGLNPAHYHQRVQCYKNLNLVWASEAIQHHAQRWGPGKRYDQRNTILIDDSALKASAQPFNLVEIPEFQGEVIEQDILGEVAGYLELLKMQQDVSKFIHKTPFKADGTWIFDWGNLEPLSPVPAAGEEQEQEPAVLTNMAG